jgi:CelD/BcsL family acetyltransferase involved in cellulose biosynthesis
MSVLTVDVVSDIRTLVTLEPAWWSLWHRARATTPFQAPAWLIPWWRAFAPGELFVVVVWHRARLLGMAPLYIDSGSGDLRLLPLGISVSDYVDLLADGAWEREVLDSVAAFLATCPTEWSEWEMPELPGAAIALSLPRPPGFGETRVGSTVTPVLALPPGTDRLATAIPARKRRDVRMARHRADRRGEVEIRRADESSATSAVDDLFRLHGARWQSRGKSGVLADTRLRPFHREAIPNLVRSGLARIYTLSIGGATAAIYYGLAHDRRHYAYLCGFDPEFAYESPGTILLAHAIEQAVDEGAAEFHFLRGGERYKYQWGAVERWNQRRILCRTVSRARAS